ncbi:MAG: signal peptidase II [Clostridiales bacterium]|nr:signal peptidase II [Clostridiales bacterium]
MILTFAVAAIVLLLDRLTKMWVLGTLKPVGDIPLWEGVFHFHYTENTGAAFGMLPGFRWVFLALSAAAALIIAGWVIYRRRGLHWLAYMTLGLILGGAVGNLIDRIRFGYVLDFLYFKLIDFAIFNVADMGLVAGSILLGVYLLFIHERHTHGGKDTGDSGGETVLHDGP